MKSKLLTNFASLSGAEAISKALTFVAFAYLARVFGSAGYGYVEWAGAILMVASLIVDQGFSSYGAREIARAPERTADLVSQIVTARIVLAALAYVALAAFAMAFVSDAAVRNLILVFGLSLAVIPFLLQWSFQGHDRMHLVSVTQIVRQVVFAAVVLLFVNGTGDLVMVGIAEVAAVGIAAGLSVVLYLRAFPAHSRLRPAFSSETFKSGGVIGLSQLFWVVKMFGATVIVGMIATASETGTFAGAMRIFIAAHTFVWLYFFNLLPSLSRAWVSDRGEYALLIRDSMRLVLWIALPVCIVSLFVAPLAMSLVYGAEFVQGAGALRWLAIACLLAAISGHFRFGLIAAGFQSREMVSSAAGAAGALVLIPAGYFFGGITYGALGLCLAEAIILAVSWLQARSIFDENHRPVVASSDITVTAG